MTLTVVILVISLGIILLLVEILAIPGTGVVGVLGGILLIVGVYYAYELDQTTGHWALTFTGLSSVALIVLSLRAKTWDKVSLKTELKGRVNEKEEGIEAGDTGLTISRIAPMGKAKINGKTVEVKSFGEYISENTEIEVVKTTSNQIIIKSK